MRMFFFRSNQFGTKKNRYLVIYHDYVCVLRYLIVPRDPVSVNIIDFLSITKELNKLECSAF